MIQAILSNRRRPDFPSVQSLFPIENYAGAYQSLQSLGIGSVAIRDCFVKDLTGAYPILKRLDETEINIDELELAAEVHGMDLSEMGYQYNEKSGTYEYHSQSKSMEMELQTYNSF